VLRVAVQRPATVKLDRGFDLSGEFLAWQQADLHARIPGYLKVLKVDLGSRVQSNELLAVLEAPELEAERVEAAAAVERSVSEEVRARATVQHARAQVAVAKASFDRLAAVNAKEKGLVAGQELDEAAARRAAAEATLAGAEAAIEAAGKNVQSAKARLARVEAMLEYTRITAPFSGTVTKRYVDPGNMIQAGTSPQTVPVVQVSDTSRLRLLIVIPETAVPDVKVGTPVDIRVPSLGTEFPGKIARFSDQVSSSSRTMAAEIDVANPKGSISPGMIAQVRLRTAGMRAVLAIPIQAVSRRGGQAFVMTVGPKGTVDERRVQVGVESASHVEVVGGVSAADRIIVGAKTLILPGQAVTPVEEAVD
jgi:RND family efflux transporter MFP subunit